MVDMLAVDSLNILHNTGAGAGGWDGQLWLSEV